MRSHELLTSFQIFSKRSVADIRRSGAGHVPKVEGFGWRRRGKKCEEIEMQYNLWYSLIYKLFIIIRSKGRQFLRFFGWHYFGCEHRCAGDSDGDDGEDEDRRKARDVFESSEIFTSPSTKSSGKLRRWKFDAKEVHLNLQNVFALSTRAMERLQGFKACKTFLRGHMVRKDFQYGIRSFFFST